MVLKIGKTHRKAPVPDSVFKEVTDLQPQVHKVDKNLSRYCNKDIEVITIEAILVTLCQP